MNCPQVYMCASPILNNTPAQPPSHPIPLGCLSQSTSFGCINSCLELALVICFTYGKVHVSELNVWDQCYSLKSSHPRLPPLSPKFCSLYLCLLCCPACRIISTIFLNSIYMRKEAVRVIHRDLGLLSGSVEWWGRIGHLSPLHKEGTVLGDMWDWLSWATRRGSQASALLFLCLPPLHPVPQLALCCESQIQGLCGGGGLPPRVPWLPA